MRVAIITGAKRGIGKAIVEAFSERGMTAVSLDRGEADVRNEPAVAEAVQNIIAEHGRIDVLVNNAGVAIYKTIAETTSDEWRTTIDTNLTGVFNVTKAVLPHFIKNRSGVIVNIASMAGRRGHPGLGAYSVSKFGVVGFGDVLAMELKDVGVKVYTICPGGVDTDMYHALSVAEGKRLGFSYGTKEMEEEKKLILKPEDVARLVAEVVMEQKLPSGSQVEISKRGGKVVTYVR